MTQSISTTAHEIATHYQTILADWLPKQSSIAIAMHDEYIYFSSTNEQFQLSVGSPVQKESIAHAVLQSHKKIDAMMDETLFDQPYYGIGYPILLNQTKAALIVILPSHFSFPEKEPISFLTGKDENGWSPVLINDVMYIESLNKKTWFYEKGTQHKTTITLKELQLSLPKQFLRIHRSYIINIRYIKTITRDLASNFQVTLINEMTLPISQSYINDVRAVLNF
ncbi:MAG TPA: LytTR family transcriptional regulator [Metalysinibacillus jejuensis]|uniref:LytTR family transcriptional regulator n=1 Tax=Metalysinibacillus jejuensis TaxID=914327 RepID=A0A921T4X0_9BACL|nr:LytTR family DNA-binding domain-containing protein [Metalysinibacillus jejuensis]HJH10384.1 LytTR family transcriptional regulator [Metalysinibacillus jejuensis]